MAGRVDHAAESERTWEHLGENVIAQEGITDATIIAESINTLRHATLALVEQQRIANLIALFTTDPTERTAGARETFADEAWDHLADDKIRQALGL